MSMRPKSPVRLPACPLCSVNDRMVASPRLTSPILFGVRHIQNQHEFRILAPCLFGGRSILRE